MERFHKAAKDGLTEILKEATRKDANAKDEDAMTPVLWAAFEGHLESLRLLCGKGGDPDKCDLFGNTALHLASARGHLHCVHFLVSFGINIYALDIDKHTAKDLAAINSRDEILRYLDTATVNFEANDKKKAKALKELAEKNCEKYIREYIKRQQKLEAAGIAARNKSNNMLTNIKQKLWSSQSNLHKPAKDNVEQSANSVKFSDLVGSSNHDMLQKNCCEYDVMEEDDGKRTITSLTGLQRDADVLYVGGSFCADNEISKRGKLAEVFQVEQQQSIGFGLSKNLSQSHPDLLSEFQAGIDDFNEELTLQRPTVRLFERPALGSLAFRRSISAALCQLQPDSNSCLLDTASNSTTESLLHSKSNTVTSRLSKPRSFLDISDSDSDGVEGYSEDDRSIAGSSMNRFLTVWGLDEYLSVFQKQQIDLETLMLLTEADLKSLGLPLGPFRKLTYAIQERRNALANPGIMQDSRL